MCTSTFTGAPRDARVRLVAEGTWVRIFRCSACGAYWDEQPGGRPVVISREEAARRVPEASGWRGPVP